MWDKSEIGLRRWNIATQERIVCLWSPAERDISDPVNYQNLDYCLAVRHWYIYMWSWTEILVASYQSKGCMTVWNPLRMSVELCRLWEGHNLCPFECRLSERKPFSWRARKCCRLENLACYEIIYILFVFCEWYCSLTFSTCSLKPLNGI